MTQNDGRYLWPKFSSYQKKKVKQIEENQTLVSAELERNFLGSKQRVGNVYSSEQLLGLSLSFFFKFSSIYLIHHMSSHHH